jgi:hypothetical protein
MDLLIARLNKLKEYSTLTSGGFKLANFHTSNSYNGIKTFRLHFSREKTLKPASFDLIIQREDSFIVDYKNPYQDTERHSFPNQETLLDYILGQ